MKMPSWLFVFEMISCIYLLVSLINIKDKSRRDVRKVVYSWNQRSEEEDAASRWRDGGGGGGGPGERDVGVKSKVSEGDGMAR